MLGLTGSHYAPAWSSTLEVDVDYLKELHKTHSDLPFLPGRINIDKYEKLVYVIFTIKETITYTKALEQELDYGLIMEKVYMVNELNQKAICRYKHITQNESQK